MQLAARSTEGEGKLWGSSKTLQGSTTESSQELGFGMGRLLPKSHCMPQDSEGPGEPSQCDQQQILGAIALKHPLLSALSLQGSRTLSRNSEVHAGQPDCQAETQGRQRHLKAAGSSALQSWQCFHLVIRVCLQVSPTILFLPAADKHV